MRRSLLALPLLWAGASVLPAIASEADTPVGLLRALYAHYPVASGRVPPAQDRPASWFGEPLLGLVLRDQKTSSVSGEAGALDFDPICACQDDTGLRGVNVVVLDEDAAQASASVGFRIGTQPVSVRYRLARTQPGWRIIDVATREVPSLVTHLRRASP